ncbi:MAG: glycine--tRNA ligase subunit beta [Desulfuromonadales bacterium]|nr:glycine--tRNA ligase subunit beta [Desulfuromonadales bacterium]
MAKELFLEIGTEEIPAGFLPKAMADMAALIRKELENARVGFDEVKTMATPRRLVLTVSGLPELQPDAEITAMGPAKSIAFTPDGKPSKAAEGFAKGQGVDVASLQVISTDKGEYIAAIRKESGKPISELLCEILPRLIGNISFKKSMRWGDFDIRFARPIHWVVALFDGAVVPFSFGHVNSGKVSYGHRFMANTPFDVKSFNHYLEECESHFVIPAPDKRREIIKKEINRTAAEAGGHLLHDDTLLDEVTYLCEYPTVIKGEFPTVFLDVPKEVLITSMRNHQRYFSIVNNDGKLMPAFITINNTLTKHPSVVVKGNERVLNARLSDARFFFEEDKKIKLEDRVESLKNVVYQQKLGTSFEKMERFKALAEGLSEELNPQLKSKVSRAAFLCKADLVTGMVGEFPEVQGIMGREYALIQGEDHEVAKAIAEHYLPIQAGGELPTSDIGAFVSIADKIDTICGCFGVGLIPTGSADPYALRRSAIGIINIILDRNYRLSLSALIDKSLTLLASKLKRPLNEVKSDVTEFFKGRFISLANDKYPSDVIEAVVAAGYDDLLDAIGRIEALAVFKERPDFSELSVTFKRVGNIVKDGVDAKIGESLFQDEAEKKLAADFKQAEEKVAAAVAIRSYVTALKEIAALRSSVDNFFDKVMVMAEDSAIRNNRLALLTGISKLFNGIADFSRLG